MKILSHSTLIVAEYRIRHENKIYIYREWSEYENGSKVIDTAIVNEDGSRLDVDVAEYEHILELTIDAVDNFSK